jgi:hypothetical protein
METLKDWSTVRDFAKGEGVSPACVYGWIQRGLPVNDALGRMLIHPPTAKQWLLDGLRSKNKQRPGAA